MDLNEETVQKHVVVDTPGQRREVITENTQKESQGPGLSIGTVGIIAILAMMVIGAVWYVVTNRNANESANRNANLAVASHAPPTTIVQPPAQQAPVIIQQPAPAPQAPVIIQQPNPRDSASDDANMQEVATKRLNDDREMTTVSVTINEARAVLTGTVESATAKTKAQQIVMMVRGVKAVDNKIVVSSS